MLAGFDELRGRAWTESLLQMRYEDPRWRPLMDLEGLRKWMVADPATMEGYLVLNEAVRAAAALPRPIRPADAPTKGPSVCAVGFSGPLYDCST